MIKTSIGRCFVFFATMALAGCGSSEPPTESTLPTSSLADDETTSSFERQPISEEQTLLHAGLDRSYYLYIPENASELAPLVVVMHGYTSSATTIMQYSGMNALADEHGFAVVYPQGTQDQDGSPFFDVGYTFHQEAGVTVDDLGFLRSLTRHLQQTYALSTDHVFSTGMSNGGDMSYLLACQASDIFKAIAPVAGMMLESIRETCTPTRPIPVFEIHGTQDYVTYWDGDMNDEDGWGAYPDIDSMIRFWVTHNNLDQESIETLADKDPSDGSSVVFERYFSSSEESEVWLYRIEGGGHDWPGAWGNQDINASEVIWDFFRGYIQ
ncbi:MAG: PHB depolymerase family esterase [Myxococcota bacterium]|nr:PHB depolymerase family esterase [Myxococcota bacterium]